MGWDAYAIGYNKEKHQKDFDKAINKILRKGFNPDGGLQYGMLDMTVCAEALEEITGKSAYGEKYTYEWMISIRSKIRYTKHDPKSKIVDWAFYSAQEFLKICLKHKLDIEFSW